MREQTKALPDTARVEGMARGRVKRYRKTHRRIDYAPSPEALAVIEKHLCAEVENSLAAMINRLIVAGDKIISGNE